MKNKKLIQANEEMLERQLRRGIKPAWYIVYHLNDGFNSRYQQKRRSEPDEVSKNIAYHKHTLYQWLYENRRWAKIPNRAKSMWSIEYGKNRERPHINILIEPVPEEFDSAERLTSFFDVTLPLRAKSVLFNSSHIKPVSGGTELKPINYICKETDERNAAIDYYSTDWIL